MSDDIKLSDRDFDAMVAAIENPPEPSKQLKELFKDNADLSYEEVSELDFVESLQGIQDHVNMKDILDLPPALRASGKRAVKAINRRNYFVQMLEVHKKRILKKAEGLFDKDSVEYQKIVKYVENLR